jgi:hypothetical protein
MSKLCNNCGETKPLNEYYKHKTNKDGHEGKCKNCARLANAQYYKNNKERILVNSKDYAIVNSDKIKDYKKHYASNNRDKILNYQRQYSIDNKEELTEKRKQYYQDHKPQRRLYDNKKYKEDIFHRLRCNMTSMLTTAFNNKGFKKGGRTEEIFGCDYKTLYKHLEDQFVDGMNWGNKGYYGWHTDHKIPLATAVTEEDVVRLCHYSNLQPLWAKDNLSKGCKLDWVKE